MSYLSSSKGVLALLRESDVSILEYALKRLLELMDTFWYEISPDLPLLEELSESKGLPAETQKLASLVVSQAYFHLGEYDESVKNALAAGNAFDLLERSLFTDTIFSRCIDLYVQHQEHPNPDSPINPKLDQLFCSLANKWIESEDSANTIKELIGFMIRSRRLDLLERVLQKNVATTKSAEILNFTLNAANILVRDIRFRRDILGLLAKMYSSGLSSVDHFSLAQCLLFLGDASGTAKLIGDLLVDGNKMLAYQLGFDLYEYGGQEFLNAVSKELESMGVVAQPPPPPPVTTEAPSDSNETAQQPSPSPAPTAAPTAAGGVEAEANEADASAAPAESTESATPAAEAVEPTPVPVEEPAPAPAPEAPAADESGKDTKLLSVLSGEVSTSMYVKFLYSRCNADVHVLNQAKRHTSKRHAVLHNAIVLAHGLMYAGTTIDGFIRDNMSWTSRARQWALFNAVATFGAVHRGHVNEGMTVLRPFLPTENSVGPLPFHEAGSLYALGLIHSPLGVNRNRSIIDYLHNALRTFSESEQMVHGASLGLGLAAMGLNDEELYDTLFTCVSGSDAVAGEAAALAIGLLMMGSGNLNAIENLKNIAYAYNQKEKIIRGISMAIAVIMLGQEDKCWPIVEQLAEHGDPWVRLGGCFTLGLAFVGTENTKAIKHLLSVAVKDTSDDVRRNATMMIGFLTIKDPNLCLELTRVLVDSYNPHIRYGVAMALAVAAAGSGHEGVINVLWDLKDDTTKFVRQGAIIALSIVMVQVSEKENPRVSEFRQLLAKVIRDSKEDGCSKFGCIIATGLLDAGGRNCTFALHKQRHRLDKAIVGMFLFSQHWFWFPYMIMITLAMQPTCFIGLNDNLEMPEYTFRSNAPPSQFAIPKSVQQQKKETKSAGVKNVVLSTTVKERQLREKLKRTAAANGDEAGSNEPSPSAPGAGVSASAVDEASKAGDEKKVNLRPLTASEEEEAHFELLQNPARITSRQAAVVTHDVDERYKLIKANPFGITILRDTLEGKVPKKLVQRIVPNTGDEDSAPPPQPFPWP